MGDLYALDFDGIICDSCGESSLSAVKVLSFFHFHIQSLNLFNDYMLYFANWKITQKLLVIIMVFCCSVMLRSRVQILEAALLQRCKAAKVRWPSLFDGVDLSMEDWIVDQMYIVRPVVETGYENLLLVRLLLEIRIPSLRKSSVADGLTIEGILENWAKLKPIIMEEWDEKENRDDLINLFGKVRDEWMEKDLATWMGANRLYPGVSDALKFTSSKIYIVTTKQSRFADALLRELAGVTIPPERIYGLGTGPKVEVLKKLQKQPEHQGLSLHFVEDRLATLKNVIKEPELDGWNLYLGDWGYNTQKEREEAASIPRIHMLELSEFSKKLK